MATRLRDYALALASVIVAAAARFALIPILGNRFGFDLFLISTFVSGRYLGYRPAIFALAAGAAAVTAFHFIGPNPDLYDPYFPVGLFAYLAFGAILVALCKSETQAQGALRRELSERRGIETELRDSRKQLVLAIEAGRLGTWQLDARTNRLQWSAIMESMHGFEPGTFGGTLSDAVSKCHPEDRVELVRQMEPGPEDSVEIRSTYRVSTPDGQARWIQSIGQSNSAGAIGVCMDVTEQKEAELELREGEQRFRVVATHAPVGIFETDAQGRCLFVNQAWCGIAGAEMEEAMGEGWQRFVHPDDRQRILKEWSDATAQRRDHVTEFRFLNKTRGARWVIGSAVGMRDSNGAVTGYVGTIVDQTDRKAAVDAVRASESRLQAILNNSFAVIYLKDVDGRYLLINKHFEELFHITLQQIIGKTDADIFPSEVVATLRANDNRVRRTGQPLEFEEVVPHDDEPHTYISIKFPVFDDEGRVTAVGGISTDITDRKHTRESLKEERELLRHTIEVQEQERQLVTFEIHDGLVQYATGALMQLESLRTQVTSNALAEQIDTITGLLQITVAEGRRIINGIRTPVLDDWGVAAAVQHLIDEGERAHVQVDFVKDDNLGRMAPSVEDALYRIAQEALNNTRKHSQAEKVLVELTRRGDLVHLEVRDWGVGFSKTNSSQEVHGLRGMASRARIVGGRCTIESAPGSGTQVLVDLPYIPRN